MPEANETGTTDAVDAPQDAVVTWTDDDGVLHHGAATNRAYLKSKEAEDAAAKTASAEAKSIETAAKAAAEQREQIKADVRTELEAEADEKAKTNKSPNRGTPGTAPAPQA